MEIWGQVYVSKISWKNTWTENNNSNKIIKCETP